MPRKAMDYSKTIIYKIQHQDNEELVYVGHTTDFIKRKYEHKKSCSENSNRFHLKLYTMIRENGGWDCFKMVMVEEYPCANKLEACRREDECMRELKVTMNSCGAVLDIERKNKYMKQWREENKEKRLEQQKKYREVNKEKCLEKMNQYREANREEINRKQREKYHAKKELKNKIS